jgi:hypothetical protein
MVTKWLLMGCIHGVSNHEQIGIESVSSVLVCYLKTFVKGRHGAGNKPVTPRRATADK